MRNNNTESKQDVVRARIDADVKKRAESILKRLGLSHSTFINLSYRAVIENIGVPFPIHIPNKETQEAIEEGRKEHGTTGVSASKFRDYLKSL